MLEQSTNMMLNESMTMAGNFNGMATMKGIEDDLKAIAPQPPKLKVPKFPTSFKSEQDIQAAKKRLQEYQGKSWTLLPTNDGSLVYTDKPTLNLSKSKVIFDKIK